MQVGIQTLQNRRQHMKKLVIAAGGIVIVIVAAFFLYRHFVINSIMDGPFMENITPDESKAEHE